MPSPSDEDIQLSIENERERADELARAQAMYEQHVAPGEEHQPGQTGLASQHQASRTPCSGLSSS